MTAKLTDQDNVYSGLHLEEKVIFVLTLLTCTWGLKYTINFFLSVMLQWTDTNLR